MYIKYVVWANTGYYPIDKFQRILVILVIHENSDGKNLHYGIEKDRH